MSRPRWRSAGKPNETRETRETQKPKADVRHGLNSYGLYIIMAPCKRKAAHMCYGTVGKLSSRRSK